MAAIRGHPRRSKRGFFHRVKGHLRRVRAGLASHETVAQRANRKAAERHRIEDYNQRAEERREQLAQDKLAAEAARQQRIAAKAGRIAAKENLKTQRLTTKAERERLKFESEERRLGIKQQREALKTAAVERKNALRFAKEQARTEALRRESERLRAERGEPPATPEPLPPEPPRGRPIPEVGR